ncbi:MAG: ubiquinone/menaquinone biosynthesis methyltransferase [Candidatus Micrarchaeaceae archaeon]
MSERIHKLFTEYHSRYDWANRLYSLGIDNYWRKEAVGEALEAGGKIKLLDIATGTAELAIMASAEASALNKPIEITGIDFNDSMLEAGRKKVLDRGIRNIRLLHGDALAMGFASSSFDVATCAFALRNFDNLEAFFKELRRILRKGGKFVILEMGNPDSLVQRAIFQFYFGILMKPVGYAIGKDAYGWLLYSITHFDKYGAVRMLKQAGFKKVKVRNLVSGVGFLITGIK